jgi:hypothetical protein
MQRGTVVGKAAENDPADHRCKGQSFHRCGNCDCCRVIGGKPVDAGGNGGKGNRDKAVALAEFNGPTIARRKRLIFAVTASVPDWSDGVDYMPRRQTIGLGDLGVAGFATIQHAAFDGELGPGRAMNRAVNTAAAQQRRIGGVDDGVNAQRRDVGDDDVEPCRADLKRGKAQAEAAVLTATPLSANSCCNSPAWNISRIISQPPTNSPLT